MNASQVIDRLLALIAEHGDLPCAFIRDDTYQFASIDVINVDDASNPRVTHGAEDSLGTGKFFVLE